MTAQLLRPQELDLQRFVRPGDGVVWGQVTGEPLELTRALMEQRHAIGRLSAFVGASFSDTVKPEHADAISFSALGGIGTNRRLAKAGVLSVLPAHLSSIPGLIRSGIIRCDIAMVQVRPSAKPGHYDYAVVSDYIVAAVEAARTVIGEVNMAAPRVQTALSIPAERFACLVESDRQVLQVASQFPSEVDRAIAAHVVDFVEDGATLQIGVGAVPDTVLSMLRDRRDLGIHSGSVGDGLVDLVEAGVVTNARKDIDRGQSVTGTLIGTDRLYRFADRNAGLTLHTVDHTHSQAVLARLPRLVSLNAALEVDLTGQVNAEVAGGLHVGAVGGQVDFVRGATASPGGRSIVALPATALGGTQSRIVDALTGPVTTARSDVDVIVTEYGAAELRGRSLEARAKALIAIAAPPFRDELAAATRSQGICP